MSPHPTGPAGTRGESSKVCGEDIPPKRRATMARRIANGFQTTGAAEKAAQCSWDGDVDDHDGEQ